MIRPGQDGVSTTTTIYKTVKGVRTSEVISTKTETTKEAVSKQVKVGTKVLLKPTIQLTKLVENDEKQAVQMTHVLDDPDKTFVKAIVKIYKKDSQELVMTLDVDQDLVTDAATFDYDAEYEVETILSYDLQDGSGQQTEVLPQRTPFELELKRLELKDVDEASLMLNEAGVGASNVLSLSAAPTDYSAYYAKVSSDRFKDIQLPISKIEEVQKDGQTVYKVTTQHPQLSHDQDYNGYEDGYVFYIAKETPSLQGIKTLRQLIDQVTANPSGEFVLADDLSADGIELAAGQKSYITTTFTGKLSGLNNGRAFAIYDLKAPLFSTLSGATVQNLDLKEVDIDSHSSKVAALVLTAQNSTTITNVAVEGNIEYSNNYGPYDGNYVNDNPIVGGIVASLSNSTITNSLFKGNIDADSTATRYIRSGYIYATTLTVGGLVGSSDNGNITYNKVLADIKINAIDGQAIISGRDQNHLTAGGIVGNFSSMQASNLLTDNYAEGKIDNQIEDHKIYYSDQKDRTANVGMVGGLLGYGMKGKVSHNISAMEVINGYMVGASGLNLWEAVQNVVSGKASGLSSTIWTSSDEKNGTFMGENSDTETLVDYLEEFRLRFAGEQTANAWFLSSSKAYIKEAQTLVNGVQIGDASIYDKLQSSAIQTSNTRGLSTDYSNMILPLLTVDKDNLYIISTMEGIQFGSIESYVNPSFKETNPEKYASDLAAFKAIVDKEAQNQAAHWAVWYRLAATYKRDQLINALPTWDNFYNVGNTKWSPEYGSEAFDSVVQFFAPTGHYQGIANDSEAYSDGREVHFVLVDALDQTGGKGPSIWTHEKVHVWDTSVYLDGYSHRDGHGGESYAEGVFQSPRSDTDGRLSNKIILNLYADYTGQDIFTEYNSSPERFQNRDDLRSYMHNLLDVIYTFDIAQANAISSLTTAQKARILGQVTAQADGTHSIDVTKAYTTETLETLKWDTVDDFVDNGAYVLITGYGYRTGRTITYARNDYNLSNLFDSNFSALSSSTGASGSLTFKRLMWEMLAAYGYDEGLLSYGTNKLKSQAAADGVSFSDDYIIRTVSEDKYQTMAEFKKAMFAERQDKLDSLLELGEIRFNASLARIPEQVVTINSFQDLQDAIAKYTVLDIENAASNNWNYTNYVTNLKKAIFVAYKNKTNEFASSIFK